MSNRILKYEIPVATEFTLQMNQGSRIIKVAVINEKAYLWAIAPQENAIIPVNFRVVMTGEEFELPYTYQYIDTFILCYGEFVGHLFVDTSVPQHMKSFGL